MLNDKLRNCWTGDQIACCVFNDNLHRFRHRCWRCYQRSPPPTHHLHLRSCWAGDHIAFCVSNDNFIGIVGITAGAANAITTIYDGTTYTCDLGELAITSHVAFPTTAFIAAVGITARAAQATSTTCTSPPTVIACVFILLLHLLFMPLNIN